jgi:DHA1 family multidrug resistance protein-like MFS transporter
MEKLERFLSRPTAKPYRTRDIEASDEVHLNDDGLLEFGPDDRENPKVSCLSSYLQAVD